MKGLLIVVGVLVIVGVVFGGQLMGSKNQLVTEKNDIDARWAQVENDMKRRADLIPNLVETVQGLRQAGTNRHWRSNKCPVRFARCPFERRCHQR